MAAYATGSDLVSRYDVDVVGELATDDRVTLSRIDAIAHANVTKALLRASGEVDVALRAGKRYLPADLANLDSNSTEHLKDIVCCCAMAKLFQRRPGVHAEMAAAIREEAREHLDRLTKGIDIFGLSNDDSREEATLPSLSGPTTVQILNRNFIATRMAGRHVPAVDDSHPLDRG